jgi:hypothetical protein
MPPSLIIALVVLASGFGSGWLVNGWRLGADIVRLENRVVILESSNLKCKSDVNASNAAVNKLKVEIESRKKSAVAASAAVEVRIMEKQPERERLGVLTTIKSEGKTCQQALTDIRNGK